MVSTALGQEYEAIDYSDPLTRSNKCKTKCVDLKKNFCTSADKTGGECFDPKGKVPFDRATNKSYCSEDQPDAPRWFKYLTCPNEPGCGT